MTEVWIFYLDAIIPVALFGGIVLYLSRQNKAK